MRVANVGRLVGRFRDAVLLVVVAMRERVDVRE